jgi:hypothetical protein
MVPAGLLFSSSADMVRCIRQLAEKAQASLPTPESMAAKEQRRIRTING